MSSFSCSFVVGGFVVVVIGEGGLSILKLSYPAYILGKHILETLHIQN